MMIGRDLGGLLLLLLSSIPISIGMYAHVFHGESFTDGGRGFIYLIIFLYNVSWTIVLLNDIEG